MARTLKITDGVTTADLLNVGSGFQLKADGWLPADSEQTQLRIDNLSGEGERFLISQPKNVFDTFNLSLSGSSHDNIAASLQTLNSLQRKAREYHTASWQQLPVYLEALTTGETNTRYAIIYDINITIRSSLFSPPYAPGDFINDITVIVEREPYWRGEIPQTLPTALTIGGPSDTPTTQNDATEQFFGNNRHTDALTHIYNQDATAGSSGNLIASSSFDFFVVSGSTPAINDAIYFGVEWTGGVDHPFFNVVLNISTLGVYVATIVVEYRVSGSWSTHSGLTMQSLSGGNTGQRVIHFDGADDWLTTNISGVTAHWIRIRISAWTSWTTSPAQSGQVIYTARENYISVANDVINGDANALAMIRFNQPVSTGTPNIEWLAVGLKSRGLDAFVSCINFGGQNPTGWVAAPVYSNGTTKTADTSSPTGFMALCTLGATTLLERVEVRTNTNDKAMTGTYNVYLRVQQIGGSIGDVSIQLRVEQTFTIDTTIVTLQSIDDGPEVLNMGQITIAPSESYGQEIPSSPNGMAFKIFVSSLSSTPDLRMYDLIFLPTDEWAAVFTSLKLTNQELTGAAGLDIDGGIAREGVTSLTFEDGPTNTHRVTSAWESNGSPPKLPPEREFRLYFLAAGYHATNDVLISNPGQGGSIKLFTHERWSMLRGAN